MPGWSRSNSGMSVWRTSPSRPKAQNSMSVSLPAADAEWQAATARHSPVRAAVPSREFTRAPRSRTLPGEPSACEARAAQPAHDVWVAPHRVPHEPRAIVLDHRDDRSLIDSQVVDVEPAGGARLCERRVERVAEAVGREKRTAVGLAHGVQGRYRDLRREGDRAAGRGGRDGAVVLHLGE